VLGELDYVDPENVFLFGWSRGGMMAYHALKRGMKANAIAVGGPLLDLFKEAERRPGMS
jgi:dipeptidyl aminopeptidase/acylaminoacyl peptidase